MEKLASLSDTVTKLATLVTTWIGKNSNDVQVLVSVPSHSKVVTDAKESSRKRSLAFSGDCQGKFQRHVCTHHPLNVLICDV